MNIEKIVSDLNAQREEMTQQMKETENTKRVAVLFVVGCVVGFVGAYKITTAILNKTNEED